MTDVSQTLSVAVGLTAAIVAVRGDEPMILTTRASGEEALPSGSFDPVAHRTFEIGLREWVREQTGAPLGYVEQLYTFGDRGRHAHAGDRDPHIVSVGYLALTRLGETDDADASLATRFQPWRRFFPWEDWRQGRPAMLDGVIWPSLSAWIARAPSAHERGARRERVRLSFGRENAPFDEERTLERYELLYEAGLVEEARQDARVTRTEVAEPLGRPMRFDHRRILATAMGRLRAKMKYRPVIFELLPETFTLTELQHRAEAISGRPAHKQNFRRLVEAAAVVEPTGVMSHRTGGRPAALYRFRRDVMQERPAPGLRMGGRG